jgi:hypothetical protein
MGLSDYEQIDFTVNIAYYKMSGSSGYHCPGHYEKNYHRSCPNQFVDYEKLLIIARKQFDTNFSSLSELYDHFNRYHFDLDNIYDQSFWITCHAIMTPDRVKLYEDMTYKNDIDSVKK